MKKSQEVAQNVGSKIRTLRLARNLSQEKLALECEMNPTFLGHVERGLRCPTIFTLQRICQGLDVSLAELFLMEESQPNNQAAVQHVCEAMRNLSPQQAQQIANIVDSSIALLATQD